MHENKNAKVLRGPKSWHELTDEERRALKKKYKSMEDTKNNKNEG